MTLQTKNFSNRQQWIWWNGKHGKQVCGQAIYSGTVSSHTHTQLTQATFYLCNVQKWTPARHIFCWLPLQQKSCATLAPRNLLPTLKTVFRLILCPLYQSMFMTMRICTKACSFWQNVFLTMPLSTKAAYILFTLSGHVSDNAYLIKSCFTLAEHVVATFCWWEICCYRNLATIW